MQVKSNGIAINCRIDGPGEAESDARAQGCDQETPAREGVAARSREPKPSHLPQRSSASLGVMGFF